MKNVSKSLSINMIYITITQCKKYIICYLTFDEQLITGKNIPSKLKSLNAPWTNWPFNVKVIMGIVKSNAQPITSLFLMLEICVPGITSDLRPPVCCIKYFH